MCTSRVRTHNVKLCRGPFHKMQVGGRAIPKGTKEHGRPPASLARPSVTNCRYAAAHRRLRGGSVLAFAESRGTARETTASTKPIAPSSALYLTRKDALSA